jgi:hypothetical protein
MVLLYPLNKFSFKLLKFAKILKKITTQNVEN